MSLNEQQLEAEAEALRDQLLEMQARYRAAIRLLRLAVKTLEGISEISASGAVQVASAAHASGSTWTGAR